MKYCDKFRVPAKIYSHHDKWKGKKQALGNHTSELNNLVFFFLFSPFHSLDQCFFLAFALNKLSCLSLFQLFFFWQAFLRNQFHTLTMQTCKHLHFPSEVVFLRGCKFKEQGWGWGWLDKCLPRQRRWLCESEKCSFMWI